MLPPTQTADFPHATRPLPVVHAQAQNQNLGRNAGVDQLHFVSRGKMPLHLVFQMSRGVAPVEIHKDEGRDVACVAALIRERSAISSRRRRGSGSCPT